MSHFFALDYFFITNWNYNLYKFDFIFMVNESENKLAKFTS